MKKFVSALPPLKNGTSPGVMSSTSVPNARPACDLQLIDDHADGDAGETRCGQPRAGAEQIVVRAVAAGDARRAERQQ